jgi:hypothetical protein
MNLFKYLYNYIMNVQWMKGWHSWMISIHDHVGNNFGHVVSNVTYDSCYCGYTFFSFFRCFIFLKEFIIALKFFSNCCYCFLWCSKVPLSHSFHFVFFVVLHVWWILHCTCHYHQYNVIALITFSYPQIQLQCIHMCSLFL